MNLKHLIIVESILISAVCFPMHHDGTKTSTQLINETLAAHPEIYDFNQQGFIGEEKSDARVEELKRRKLEIIENEILHKIEENLRILRKENTISIAGQTINRSTVSTFVREALMPALAWVISGALWNPPDSSTTDALNPDSSTTDALNAAMYNHKTEMRHRAIAVVLGTAHAAVETNLMPAGYESKIREYTCAKEDIEHALKHDSLFKDEERVVRGWHTFQEGMQKTLKDALIGQRVMSGKDKGIRGLKEQIDYCLKLPTKYKMLIPGIEGDDYKHFIRARDSFISDKFATTPWCNYSKATKENLKGAFTLVCDQAHQASMGKKTKRRILCFHGKPGTGKSTAAREFANIFDLPVMTLVFSSSDDLSRKNLTGNSSFASEQKLGVIFQPLFACDKQGQNWKNAVVIIEEFDRLHKKDGILPSTLHLFDPDTKKLECDYFGKNVTVEIEGMIFILTANWDLGKSEASSSKSSNAQDQFEALRDRIKFIEFDQFQEAARADLIKKFVTEHGSLKRSTPFVDEDHEEVLKEMISFITSNFPKVSTREDERLAEVLASLPRIKWDTIK